MRVTYKSIWFDNFFQPNSAANTVLHWRTVTGTWAANTGELRQTAAATHSVIMPADRDRTAFRVLQQDRKVIYEFRMKLVDVAGAAERGGLIWCASTTAGDYLGNSYVLEQTAAAMSIYKSTANVLGAAIDTDPTGATLGTWYYYKVVWDPTTGSIIVYRGTSYPAATEVLNGTDGSLTNQAYAGLWSDDAEAHFDEVDWHFDTETDLIDFAVERSCTFRPGTLKFVVPAENDGGLDKYAYGDWLRVVLSDGTTAYKDFLGRITQILQTQDTMSPAESFVAPGEVEVTVTEFHGFELRDLEVRRTGGGAVDLNGLATAYLAEADFVTAKDVATGGNTKNTTTRGRYAQDLLRQLAFETGTRMVGSADGQFSIDTTHPASGVTFDNDNIRSGRRIMGGWNVANRARVYTADGADSNAVVNNTTLQRSTGKGPAYGPRSMVVADRALTSVAAGGDAEDLANYWLTRYGTAPDLYELWVYGGHGVEPSETVTVTCDLLGLSAEAMIVMQKSYSASLSHLGIRFLLAKSSAGEQWPREGLVDSLIEVGNGAVRSMADNI